MQVRIIAALLLVAATATPGPISSSDIRVVDGDIVDVGPDRYRLVGFDTPEINTPRRKVSPEERAMGLKATARLKQIISSGRLDLQEVRCSCTAQKIADGTCNHAASVDC